MALAALSFQVFGEQNRHAPSIGRRCCAPLSTLVRPQDNSPMTRNRKIIAITVFIAHLALGNVVFAQRTTRTRLKTQVNPSAHTKERVDTLATVATDSLAVVFSGYEKTLRSSRESVFVTNRTSSHINEITFLITYHDMQGRALHRRHINVSASIAPNQTTKVDFPSWDTQKVFYYHLSPEPRTKQATPYSVKIQFTNAVARQKNKVTK